MTTAAWYHRDISRVRAEELLAHAGRNGSFLVRDSESVPGAYALCLLFFSLQTTAHIFHFYTDFHSDMIHFSSCSLPAPVFLRSTCPCLPTLNLPLSSCALPAPVFLRSTCPCLPALYLPLSSCALPAPVFLRSTCPCLPSLYLPLSSCALPAPVFQLSTCPCLPALYLPLSSCSLPAPCLPALYLPLSSCSLPAPVFLLSTCPCLPALYLPLSSCALPAPVFLRSTCPLSSSSLPAPVFLLSTCPCLPALYLPLSSSSQLAPVFQLSTCPCLPALYLPLSSCALPAPVFLLSTCPCLPALYLPLSSSSQLAPVFLRSTCPCLPALYLPVFQLSTCPCIPALYLPVFQLSTCPCLPALYLPLSSCTLHAPVFLRATCPCLPALYLPLSSCTLLAPVFLLSTCPCLPALYLPLFQRHVHTYRILPDTDGLLALQVSTTQGVQVNCFRTIGDLILGYQQPHKGLVSPLLYPVGREMEPADESSDGDDEKPGSALNPVPSAAAPPAGHSPPASQTAAQFLLRRLQEINTPSSVASEMVALLGEYLHGDVTLDLENLRTGGSGLHFLQRILATACHRLHSEIDQTMFSLETLAKVFDHPSCPLTASKIQNMGRSPEDNLDTLLHKITALSNLLSSLENRVLKALQDAVANHNLSAQPSPVANHNLSAQPLPMANHNPSAQPSRGANHNLSAQPLPAAELSSPVRPRAKAIPVHSFQASTCSLVVICRLNSALCQTVLFIGLTCTFVPRDPTAEKEVTCMEYQVPPVMVEQSGGGGRPESEFTPVQVKVFRYGRQTVSVDVNAGVLLFDRKTGPFSIETITHDRILQLVKFSGSPTKLRMVVDSHQNQPHEVLFESVKKREAFCQLLQLMKTIHAQQGEPDLVSVFVGTWNMGGSPPPRSLQSWVTCSGLGLTPDESTASLPHDIYAFGTQDNPQGEKEWTENIRGTLRTSTQLDFKQVALQSLWNIRLAVFVKPEHERRISQIHTASLKRGLGNTLGNKGAVGISFLFNSTAMGFVNCHLTSGSEKALRRNQNFQDILRLLSLGDRQIGAFDLSMRFTHLFWCGDLNYRLDLDVQDILKHVSKREFKELMCADQLTRERHKRKAFFTFSMTFALCNVNHCNVCLLCAGHYAIVCVSYSYLLSLSPLRRGEDYISAHLPLRARFQGLLPMAEIQVQWGRSNTHKPTSPAVRYQVRVNGPSWCDRVLWKSYPETYITCTSYGCTDDIFTSDHSPVFATFHVGVTTQLPRADSSVASDRAWIELETVEAIVKTASKARFFIEFHSRCLEGAIFVHRFQSNLRGMRQSADLA
ncbi:hypothetical protein P4O66_020085 [Electrophorus voltai]|uniref:phosphatidylinositol-3,4,5-trisphosphate 5-phosphatase n=1 Tax=Electrophorus voltai TaxID=2609070 RepID=A0AAD8ZSW9_9TELE|nr:hypothetical protein P4O66_020085 [Electrophorus voltai]